MTRVLQIIDTLHWGGAQALQLILAEQAKNTDFELTVVSLMDNDGTPYRDKLETLGVRVCVFPAKKLMDLKRMRLLMQFLRQERFDLVHTHLSSANIVGGIASRMSGAPLISTLHLKSEKLRRARKDLETWVLRKFPRTITAVGSSVAEAHRERLKREILVMPNPIRVAASPTSMERVRIRNSLFNGSEVPIAISVGRLSPEKGYPDLLKAFSLLQKDCRLVLVGDGPQRSELEHLIRNLNLQNSVHLLGARTDVDQLLTAADFYVSSSLTEGMSISILEAFAAGVPVIATAVGDTPKLVNQKTGILVSAADPENLMRGIQSLLHEPKRAQALAAAAKDYVMENHSPKKWFDELCRVYRDTLNIAV